MKYDGSVYERAEKELALRRSKAEKEREMHHSEVVEKYPEIAELERQMAICGLEAAKAIGMNKEKSAEFIETLKNHNLAAQRRRAEILKEAGYPEDYLEVKYSCPVCNDKGFIDGRMCPCYKNLIRTIAYDKLSRISPITVSTFEDFSLDYYPETPLENGVVPRRLMAGNYRYCKNYADNFSLTSPSLILYGATGLGKTHLSLAIAGEAIKKGFGVIYGSAQNLLNRLENEKFGRICGEDESAAQSAEIFIRYEGYLKKGLEQIERARKLEEKKLPPDIDYLSISGLRLEAREKLEKVKPASLGQASRIPGVNPADIAVLILYLK